MKEIDCIVAAEDFIARTSHAWNGEGVHPNTIIEGLRKLTHLPLISDMNALTLLVMKWRYMEGGSSSLASQNRKDAFRRCANDLERTMKLMQLPIAAPVVDLQATAPGIDIEHFHQAVQHICIKFDGDLPYISGIAEVLDLIKRTKTDASPKGGSRGRYFCDGPEGHFFCDDLKLARDLVNAYDKDDDWTITDLQVTSAEVKG